MIYTLFERSVTKMAAIAALGLLAMKPLPAQTVWLDQLDLSTATQGYGTAQKNKSIDGKIMTIAGKTFVLREPFLKLFEQRKSA